jgi:hypothetical protein
MPGTGRFKGGLLHTQIGDLGTGGLALPGTTSIPIIVKGKTHFQQISVTGLTKRPTQLACTGREKKSKNKNMMDMLLESLNPSSSFLNFLTLLVGLIVVLAGIFRHIPAVPEPNLRITMPFGKIPFFDGVFLYGLFIILVLISIKLISLIL